MLPFSFKTNTTRTKQESDMIAFPCYELSNENIKRSKNKNRERERGKSDALPNNKKV